MSRRGPIGILILMVIVALPLALIGGGIYYIVQQQTGTPATATVSECHRSGKGYVCTGSWTGEAVAGADAQVGAGTINGAVSGDEGTTVDVVVRDGTAYTTSLATPLTLIGLGAGLPLLVWFSAWRQRRKGQRNR